MADLTPFGKAVRKIRIDRGETLGAMAEALEISSALLSSLEAGKRNMSDALLEKILSHCKVKGPEAQELKRLALESRTAVTLKPKEKDRSLVSAFARKFEELDKKE